METLGTLGRLFFGLAITAFGVEHLILAWTGAVEKAIFKGKVVLPVIPWAPAHTWLACLIGLVLFVCGVSIASNLWSRRSAILVGLFFPICVLLRITSLFTHRTVSFELLALGGAALALAGTLPAETDLPGRWASVIAALTPSGLYLFAVSSVVFGVDHFLFLGVVAGLVPPWIPWHMFWAYFTGAGLVAAGLSLAIRWMGQLAATMLGVMFLLWFVLLHAPRIFGLSAVANAPGNPNEWSSAFIALGMGGGAWICGWALVRGRQNQDLETQRDEATTKTKAKP